MLLHLMIYRWAEYLKCLKALYQVLTYLVFTPLSGKKCFNWGRDIDDKSSDTTVMFTLEKMPKSDEKSYTQA